MVAEKRRERSEDSYQVGEIIMYHEDGAVIKASVVDNTSNNERIRYSLKVEEIVRPHRFGAIGPENGETFPIEKKRGADICWKLLPVPK